jgi:hypothetical protein
VSWDWFVALPFFSDTSPRPPSLSLWPWPVAVAFPPSPTALEHPSHSRGPVPPILLLPGLGPHLATSGRALHRTTFTGHSAGCLPGACGRRVLGALLVQPSVALQRAATAAAPAAPRGLSHLPLAPSHPQHLPARAHPPAPAQHPRVCSNASMLLSHPPTPNLWCSSRGAAQSLSFPLNSHQSNRGPHPFFSPSCRPLSHPSFLKSLPPLHRHHRSPHPPPRRLVRIALLLESSRV